MSVLSRKLKNTMSVSREIAPDNGAEGHDKIPSIAAS
jgi:hypothetical protein